MTPPDDQIAFDTAVADVLSRGAAARSAARCVCHGRVDPCCPDRVGQTVAAALEGQPAAVAAIIDHTLLRPDATAADIDVLCDEADAFRFASVCVHPAWVRRCAERLDAETAARRRPSPLRTVDSGERAAAARPRICAVIGFPLGAGTSDTKGYEARRAILDGAGELDMVINIGALKSGDLRWVASDIAAVVVPCRAANIVVKVILETALLTDDEKRTACRLAQDAGADFVKTSTGFGPGGATVTDVRLMRDAVDAAIGVKASGGIRDLATLRAMVEAGAIRIGTSAGVAIVREAEGRDRTTTTRQNGH